MAEPGSSATSTQKAIESEDKSSVDARRSPAWVVEHLLFPGIFLIIIRRSDCVLSVQITAIALVSSVQMYMCACAIAAFKSALDPPREWNNKQIVVEVACLQKLYRVFERC